MSKTVLLAGVALAGLIQTCLVPAAAAPYLLLFESETARCEVRVAAEPAHGLLRVDMQQKQSGVACALSREETVALYTRVFAAQANHGRTVSYHSVMIGDVSDYGWLQRYLTDTARADPNWSREKGRPVTGHANHYVNAVLSRPDVLAVWDEAGARYGYHFTRTDCEKVFISDNGLPVDAFCWMDFRH